MTNENENSQSDEEQQEEEEQQQIHIRRGAYIADFIIQMDRFNPLDWIETDPRWLMMYAGLSLFLAGLFYLIFA